MSSSGQFVTTISDSFLMWFKESVFPYLFGSICVIVVITSIAINSFMLTVLKKRNLLTLPSNRFMLQLIILDLLACAFVLLPSIIAAFAKEWLLSTPVCYMHAIMINWLFLVMFALVTTTIAQQTIKQIKPQLAGVVFTSNVKVSIISLVIWLVDLAIAVAPTSGFVDIKYDYFHASCIVYLDTNIPYLSCLLAFGIVIPMIMIIVFFVLLSKNKKKKAKERKAQTKLEKIKLNQSVDGNMPRNVSTSSIGTNATCASESEDITPSDGQRSRLQSIDDVFSPQQDDVNRKRYQKNNQRQGAQRQSKAARMFKRAASLAKSYESFDDHSDEDHHLAVTYLIIWSFLIASWLPYLVLAFYNAIIGGLWRGYYSLLLIFAFLSFFSKPIIYLAHNRHFQEKSKQTLPQNVIRKVSSVRMSLSSVVDKLDGVLFKSPKPVDKQIGVAIATNKAKNAFLGKLKKTKESANLVINEEKEHDEETSFGTDNHGMIQTDTRPGTSKSIQKPTSVSPSQNRPDDSDELPLFNETENNKREEMDELQLC